MGGGGLSWPLLSPPTPTPPPTTLFHYVTSKPVQSKKKKPTPKQNASVLALRPYVSHLPTLKHRKNISVYESDREVVGFLHCEATRPRLFSLVWNTCVCPSSLHMNKVKTRRHHPTTNKQQKKKRNENKTKMWHLDRI